MQFIAAGGTGATEPYTATSSGGAITLPASAKAWNATITEEGKLTLK
jgi:hypothetical protein